MNNFIDYPRLGQAADELIQDIRTELENNHINAHGNLSNSLGWQITAKDTGMSLSVYADSYWDYAIGGRGPGKVPGNFIEILEDWIRVKGIVVEQGTIRQFAGAIMYNIKNYGSRRWRDNDKADVLTVPVEKFLEKVGDMVAPNNIDLGI